jgi:hypothetical protein
VLSPALDVNRIVGSELQVRLDETCCVVSCSVVSINRAVSSSVVSRLPLSSFGHIRDGVLLIGWQPLIPRERMRTSGGLSEDIQQLEQADCAVWTTPMLNASPAVLSI